MTYRFQYKAYRRRFSGHFSNAREQFPTREGLWVRIEDKDGRVGFGEASPLPSFGTESFASALAVAESIGERVEFESVLQRLKGFPALRWGCETALAMIDAEGEWPEVAEPWPIAALISDANDRKAVEERLAMHYQCLKVKIGKTGVLEEMKALDRIIEVSEGRVGLRLDANGTLSKTETLQWLEWAAENPVEFLEQPLDVGEEREMQRIAVDFPTPLALDESIGSVDDLKRWRDAQWGDLFVIKPSLCGDCRGLSVELEAEASDCVFSSSLETKVGAAHAIALAVRFGDPSRALGFGVEPLFADRNVGLELGPFLQNGMWPSSKDLETLWNLI